MRISQGDTVLIQKYGGKRGISIIIGILPKSKDTVLGSGRFDAKSGYFGDLQAKGLFGSKQEFSENAGHETPETTPRCTNKDKTVPAKRNEEKFKELGLGTDVPNTKGQLKKPPGNDKSLDATLAREDAALSAALDAELERARQGDRSGLDGALDIS